MEASALFDEFQRVDRNDFPTGEKFLEKFRHRFLFFISVDRQQYGMIGNEKVGIGGRQTLTLFVFR